MVTGSTVGYGALSPLSATVWYQTVANDEQVEVPQLLSTFQEMIRSSDTVGRIEGALGIMHLCFTLYRPNGREHSDAATFAEPLKGVAGALVPMVFSENPWEHAAACWALAWLGSCQVWVPPAQPDILGRFYTLWRHTAQGAAKRYAVWALATQIVAPRDGERRLVSVQQSELVDLFKASEEEDAELTETAALVVGWYLRAMSDPELLERARQLLKLDRSSGVTPVLKQLVVSLSAEAPKVRKSRKRKT
jgi:hypothetical protein